MISALDAGAVIEEQPAIVHGGTRLGERLVDAKVLTENQVSRALAEQRRTGRRLGAVLVESGAIDERTLLSVLSIQLDLPVLASTEDMRLAVEGVHPAPEIEQPEVVRSSRPPAR